MKMKPPVKYHRENQKMGARASVQGNASVNMAMATEETQWTKYRNRKTNHGFAAEDANAINEKLRLKKVDKVGTSNTKNGPDRITNGVSIQSKYYQTAKESVEAAFSHEDGKYRYSGQVLEVPKDQYEQAVELMKEKIREGKVPGVRDPQKAAEIVKRGDITYRQARNIARAGNVDSLWFDMKTQAVSTGYAFGISFAIHYAFGRQIGLKKSDAFKLATGTALKSGCMTLASGVLTQQFLRTSSGRSAATMATRFSREMVNGLYKTGAGKIAIEKLASALIKKPLHGAAAKNVITKLLRTNQVTAAVTTTVLIAPGVYRALVSKSISWSQFSKNLAVNISGVGGGAAGAIYGSAAGSFKPGPGTVVGGIIGGIIGGMGVSLGAKKIADWIVEDDARRMLGLINDAVCELAYDYLVTEQEFEEMIFPEINRLVNARWLRKMYKKGARSKCQTQLQKEYAYAALEPIFHSTIMKRRATNLPEGWMLTWELVKVKIVLGVTYIASKIRTLFISKINAVRQLKISFAGRQNLPSNRPLF
jgi:hypothetical protein